MFPCHTNTALREGSMCGFRLSQGKDEAGTPETRDPCQEWTPDSFVLHFKKAKESGPNASIQLDFFGFKVPSSLSNSLMSIPVEEVSLFLFVSHPFACSFLFCLHFPLAGTNAELSPSVLRMVHQNAGCRLTAGMTCWITSTPMCLTLEQLYS